MERLSACELDADIVHLRDPRFHVRDLLTVDPAKLDAGPSHERPIAVGDASGRPQTIAVLGDSICHGVRSTGCAHTEHAWPNVLAQALGVEPTAAPSMIHAPFNADVVAARLAEGIAANTTQVRVIRLICTAWRTAREAAAQNRQADRAPEAAPNLAVSAYTPVDLVKGRVYGRSGIVAKLLRLIGLGGLTASAQALDGSVLGPHATSVDALQARVDDHGPVDLLILAIGANCALKASVTCKPRWTGEPIDDETPPTWDPEEGPRVWRPRLFAAALGALLVRIGDPDNPLAKRVLVVTVPHVTVAPIAAGEGSRLEGAPDYFERYVPKWEVGDAINGRAQMSGAEVQRIDKTIDVYNKLLADAVDQRLQQRWSLFDLCELLDRYALLRNRHPGRPDRAREYPPTPEALLRRSASERPGDDAAFDDEALKYLDTRYAHVESIGDEPRRLVGGGLVSLDGVHPTGAAQGLIAHHAIGALARADVPWAGSGLQRRLPWDALVQDPLTEDAVRASQKVPPPVDGAWARLGAIADVFDVLGAIVQKSPLRRTAYVKRALQRPFTRGPGRPRR